MEKRPVAYQIYSAREEAAKDLNAVLAALKGMGYDGVEFAGFYGMTAEQVKKALDNNGLVAISSHVPFAQIEADMFGTIAYHQAIGCNTIAVPYLDDATRPGAPGFAHAIAVIDKFGRLMKEAGMTLLYHNHDFEFVELPDGRMGYDDMFEQTPADALQCEPDTCWITVAGQDAAAYVRKYAGRNPIVHLKDFILEGKPKNLYKLIGIETEEEENDTGRFEFRSVGFGNMVWEPVLAATLEAGSKWVIVEQDEHYNLPSLECARRSREYLRILGW